jgi:hypothetical protein
MEPWMMALSLLGGFFAGFVAGYLLKAFWDAPVEGENDANAPASKIPDYYFDQQRTI